MCFFAPVVNCPGNYTDEIETHDACFLYIQKDVRNLFTVMSAATSIKMLFQQYKYNYAIC